MGAKQHTTAVERLERRTGAHVEQLDRAASVAVVRAATTGGARAAAGRRQALLLKISTEEIVLPPEAASMVIGKGGSTIRAIEGDTGAQLRIARDEGDATLRLRGEAAAIEAARARVSAIVEDVVRPAVKVAVADVPRVLGAGGATSKLIEAETGAKLRLERSTTTTSTRSRGTASRLPGAATGYSILWLCSSLGLALSPRTGARVVHVTQREHVGSDRREEGSNYTVSVG